VWNRRLTVNLGCAMNRLFLERNSGPSAAVPARPANCWCALKLNSPTLPREFISLATRACLRTVLNASLNNFAPRVGFALDVFATAKIACVAEPASSMTLDQWGHQQPLRGPILFSPQLIFSTGVVNPGTISDPLCTQGRNPVASKLHPASELFPAPFPPPSSSTFLPAVFI